MSEVQCENEGNNLDKRMDTTVQNEETYSAHSDVKLREKFGVKDLRVALRKVEGGKISESENVMCSKEENDINSTTESKEKLSDDKVEKMGELFECKEGESSVTSIAVEKKCSSEETPHSENSEGKRNMSDYECDRLQSEICDDEVKKAEVDHDSLQVSEKCDDENGNLSGPEGEMSKSEISDKYVDKIKIEEEALEVPTKTEEEEDYISGDAVDISKSRIDNCDKDAEDSEMENKSLEIKSQYSDKDDTAKSDFGHECLEVAEKSENCHKNNAANSKIGCEALEVPEKSEEGKGYNYDRECDPRKSEISDEVLAKFEVEVPQTGDSIHDDVTVDQQSLLDLSTHSATTYRSSDISHSHTDSSEKSGDESEVEESVDLSVADEMSQEDQESVELNVQHEIKEEDPEGVELNVQDEMRQEDPRNVALNVKEEKKQEELPSIEKIKNEEGIQEICLEDESTDYNDCSMSEPSGSQVHGTCGK